jgi:hypothetical protein
MKYIKEELEDLIFKQNLSYREIGRQYGVSDTYIKKVANKLGISLRRRRSFPEGFVPFNKGKGKARFCNFCNKELDVFAKKYCSAKCQSTEKSQNVYKDFLENNDKYCRSNYSPKALKKFFLEEQNNSCAICSMKDEWNDKKLVFILDHIDGNAANNKRENLRLVCPNCDSQLDTYKSKNKNSARKERYILNYKTHEKT